ncbi:hypothetical protein L596_028408 [Steinernema carpocapsae]|uniref:Uncharacterized protein n=1 Tax=Steinernema carpocapsae TaxID=34508 RepID=A0A4U5LYC8_STECR|nr:hypothetical protein L596_028408 [Steinernema carpocapsae]
MESKDVKELKPREYAEIKQMAEKPEKAARKLKRRKRCSRESKPCVCDWVSSKERDAIYDKPSHEDPNPLPHDYKFTYDEGIANFLSHAICIIPAIIAWYRIQSVASNFKESAVCFVYGTGLLLLFFSSSLYHLVYLLEQTHSCKTLCHKIRPFRRFLSFMDRAAIFLFIAGSYTPWLTLMDTGKMGTAVCRAIWVAAIGGIVYHQTSIHTKYPKAEAFIYLIVAVLPATVLVSTMIHYKNSIELVLLILGGFFYIFGIYFFLKDGVIRYNHAIWHMFVNIGAAFHYVSMHHYLLNEVRPRNMSNHGT